MSAATMPRPDAVHVRAPGKINLRLRVGPVRRDGYHPLATVFQAVSLFEDVHARVADDISVSVSGRHAERVPTDERNLAHCAATLLADATGTSAGVHLHITKEVPVAGGMGGGSADAAATLLACDQLWGTGLDREELGHLAAELGADVPFALTGQTALGVGRGDMLTPALARGRYHWVLAVSETGLPTPEVFASLDASGTIPPNRRVSVPPSMMKALLTGEPSRLTSHLVNDLAEPAVHLRPHLTQVLAAFEGTDALATIVSGSGPTIAALAADHTAAVAIAEQVRRSRVADEVLVVHGPVPGARLTEQVRTDR
ncbi:4-(cytidine 5'-diphospho)-2-C-methyl-D-erythritol kinase [Pseudactinotalea sp. Z1732]|uniref:4-(cytidine 5'-diphospho)-2-C-methyl-D-erythritol kinase n=1 Tax=Pseudactinotalea sp. Z1732 TaxID=3413026 RepID=UPI003C7E727C